MRAAASHRSRCRPAARCIDGNGVRALPPRRTRSLPSLQRHPHPGSRPRKVPGHGVHGELDSPGYRDGPKAGLEMVPLLASGPGAQDAPDHVKAVPLDKLCQDGGRISITPAGPRRRLLNMAERIAAAVAAARCTGEGTQALGLTPRDFVIFCLPFKNPKVTRSLAKAPLAQQRRRIEAASRTGRWSVGRPNHRLTTVRDAECGSCAGCARAAFSSWCSSEPLAQGGFLDASCRGAEPCFGTKGSQVRILSPRPSQGRRIAEETGETAALVFSPPNASHHRLTKPGDAAYRALVWAALHAIDVGDLEHARRLLHGLLRALGGVDDGGCP